LQYLVTLAVDLADLINQTFEKADISVENHRKLLSSLEPNEKHPIVVVILNLFTHYVVYDRGMVREKVLGVIRDRIWPLLTQPEKSEFFSSIVHKFLASPKLEYS